MVGGGDVEVSGGGDTELRFDSEAVCRCGGINGVTQGAMLEGDNE